MDRSLLHKEGGADTELPKEESIERLRKYLILLATLVASVTYQAGLNPPGGIWDNEEDGHRPGRTVVKGRPHDARLKAFFFSNTMAFAASLVTLVLLRKKKLLLWKYEKYGFMAVTLLGLLAAYAAGSSRETDTTSYVSSLVGAVAVCVLVQVVGFVFLFRKNGNGSSDGRQKQNPGEGTNNDMEGGADKEAPKEEDNERRRQLLLVLATLVASVTYQVRLNQPGGIWDNEEDGHRPGHAVLKGRPHDARLKAFFYCNAMAFVASLVTLLILLDKKLLLWNYENYGFMGVTLLALLAAYAAGSSLETDTTIYVSSLVGAVVVCVLVQVVALVFLCRKNDNGRIDRYLPAASTIHPRVRDHLAAAFNLVLVLVIFNSAMAIYLCRADLLSVAAIAVSSVEVVLLFALHQRRGEPGHGGGGMLLKAGICCLATLLAVLLACKLVQIGAPSTHLLFGAVAGAMALGVGGCCAFLLHRQNWSKQPCQEVVITLRQGNKSYRNGHEPSDNL